MNTTNLSTVLDPGIVASGKDFEGTSFNRSSHTDCLVNHKKYETYIHRSIAPYVYCISYHLKHTRETEN